MWISGGRIVCRRCRFVIIVLIVDISLVYSVIARRSWAVIIRGAGDFGVGFDGRVRACY